MQFDRKITISAGSSRRAMVWQAQTLLISELWAKLQTPPPVVCGGETLFLENFVEGETKL